MSPSTPNKRNRKPLEDVEGDTGRPSSAAGQRTVIPVVSEELAVSTRSVKTGAVRVHKRIRERVERVDLPLLKDTVEIKRVVLNQVVPEIPRVRKEGNTIIVPVIEEEIVVTKRLVLREEVHLVRRRTRSRTVRDVTLRREEAQVERVDAGGGSVPVREASAAVEPPGGARRRSILDRRRE